MALPDAAAVTAATGVEVTDDQVAQALAIIELMTGRVAAEEGANMSATDLVWFNRAVSYQAAWMSTNSAVFTSSDVQSLSQGGDLSITYRSDSSASSKYLAPLASRAIKRMSSSGSRSVQASTPFSVISTTVGDSGVDDDDPSDPEYGWESM